jgi:ParB-like chromosome segregation protein Spo0J
MIQHLPITQIKLNPNNPRVIKDDKFKQLVKSIKDLPEMGNVRPIVVNQDMIVLGGNMRLKAMQEVGLKIVPVVMVDWDEDKQRQFIIKDNIGYGEWDFDMLANEWDELELNDWGLDLPNNLLKDTDDLGKEFDTDLELNWLINIKCNDENHAKELYEKFVSEGLEVKIIN